MPLYFPISEIDRRLAADDLFGRNIFAVGGRVRDHFTNAIHGTTYISKDYDFVIVGLRLDEVHSRLAGVGRIDEVGRSFPTLKVTVNGTQLDVALARREQSFGPGHNDFDVQFGPDVTLRDDALRRDFRMNMLSVSCATGEVFDPVDGISDIRHRRVSLHTPQAFADDPLRMERAVQFASRFSFAIDDQTYEAIKSAAPLIRTCSAERHQIELDKMIGKSAQPSRGFNLLKDTGLLAHIIPEMLEGVGLSQNDWHDKDVFDHNMAALDAAAVTGDLIDRYAAAFHDIGKPRTVAKRLDGRGNSFHGHEDVGAEIVRDVMRRLRYSEDMVRTVSGLTQEHMYACLTSDGKDLTDAGVRRFISKIRAFSSFDPEPEELSQNVERQFRLRQADRIGGRSSAGPVLDRAAENAAFEARVRAELHRTPVLSVSALAIDGHTVRQTLIEANFKPPNYRGDRTMAQVFAGLLNAVIDDPTLNQPDVLRAMIPAIAQQISDTQAAEARAKCAAEMVRHLPIFTPAPVDRVDNRRTTKEADHQAAVIVGRTSAADGVYVRAGGSLVVIRPSTFTSPPKLHEHITLTRDASGLDRVMPITIDRTHDRL